MRLITHMLSSNIKGVTKGFPLGIVAEKVAEKRRSGVGVVENTPTTYDNVMSSSHLRSKNFLHQTKKKKVAEKQVDLNVGFLKNMFTKIEWKTLLFASRTMGYAELPEEVEPSKLDSEEFLHKFHHALLELHLEEGALVCPETGRRFRFPSEYLTCYFMKMSSETES